MPGANVLGMRLPGCFDSFETCCLIILQQDIGSISAANLASYIACTYGQGIEGEDEICSFVWPLPSEMLEAKQRIAENERLEPVRKQMNVILIVAQALEAGSMSFDPLGDIEHQKEMLLSIDGISEECAANIILRVLCDPDISWYADSPLIGAMREVGKDTTQAETENQKSVIEACHPYRSYTAVGLWYARRANAQL
mgnify:CR=1 FL=1